jgi:hypothetical protein
MQTARLPALDATLVGGRALYRFEILVAVQNAVGKPVDPVLALGNFAIGNERQPLAQRRSKRAERFLGGIERDAAYEQQIIVHAELLWLSLRL